MPAALLAVVLAVAPAATTLAQDSTAAPAPEERKTSTGVFSSAQATRGENVFQINCVSCHATTDYMGEQFQLDWVTRTAFDIFDAIRSQMPEDNPGILAREEYLDVVAYIFSLNKYPTGEGELAGDDDSLKKIRIDDPPPPSVDLAMRLVHRNLAPHPVVRRGR